MTRTATGSFPIGFRRGWSDWQKDLAVVIDFAKSNHFDGIDVGAIEPAEVKKIVAGGLRVGTVDAKDWPGLGSADAGKLQGRARQANAEYFKAVGAAGCKNFFTVLIPEDHARPRQENFKFFVDGLGQMCAAVESSGVAPGSASKAGPAAGRTSARWLAPRPITGRFSRKCPAPSWPSTSIPRT